jgi:glucosyl-dolichyl phosphate glucuronosyltransferase
VDVDMTPFVSVILATRNREHLLAQTLDALQAQDWPKDRFEIVVSDNGSADGTRALVEAVSRRPNAPSVRYVCVSRPGKSYAVNAALSQVRGELLAFADDDVLPEPTWIRRLAVAFAETNADFVAGRILPRWETAPPAWMSPAIYGVLAIPDNGERRKTIGPGGSTDIMPIGANMAVRLEVVRRVGGLREDLGKLEGTLRTGEDHDFYLRMIHAGCRGTYEPSALVRHWVPRERLRRGYFCRWLHQNGRDVARVESGYATDVRRFLNVPRYLWRQAAAHAGTGVRSAITGDGRRLFASALRVIWFAGYLRESWFGRAEPPQPSLHAAEGR